MVDIFIKYADNDFPIFFTYAMLLIIKVYMSIIRYLNRYTHLSIILVVILNLQNKKLITAHPPKLTITPMNSS